MIVKRWIKWLVLAIVVVSLAGCGGEDEEQAPAGGAAAAEETFEMQYGDANPVSDTPTPMARFAEYFIERLDANSEGRIKVDYFPNGELGGTPQMLSGAQSGSIDFVNLSSGTMVALDKQWEVFALPFLVEGHEQLFQLFESDLGQEVLGSLEGKGLTGLTLNTNGPFVLVNNQRPIEAPEDYEGLKVRIASDPTSQKMLEVLGGQPVELDFAEVYTSLQQGVIDGVIASPGAMAAVQLPKVAEYASPLAPQWVVEGLLMSNNTMEALPPELQEAVRKSAEEAAQFAKEDTGEIAAESLKALEEAGAVITPDVDPAPFLDKMGPVYDALEEDLGAEMIERARAAVSG